MLKRPTSVIGTFILPAVLVLFFSLMTSRTTGISILLLYAGIALIYSHLSHQSLEDIYRRFGFFGFRLHWLSIGIVFAFLLAAFLRWKQGRPLYPWPIGGFSITAILIGSTEELLFRGYFYGELETTKTGTCSIIITTSFLHAIYKGLLFLGNRSGTDLLIMGGVTFMVGISVAGLRKISGSIWPCVVAHAFFDLWVYGDRSTPPWIW